MTEQILQANYFLSLGTLLMELVLIILLLLYVSLKVDRDAVLSLIQPVHNLADRIYDSIEKAILIKIFAVSTLASILTLYYSEVLGVIPCALCWFERIFMYGIVLISGTALFARNKLEQRGIFRYIIVFSIFGAIVAAYHHILQMLASVGTHLPCPASGGECSKRIIFEFGHITFPWMAFVLFIFFILILLVIKELVKTNN